MTGAYRDILLDHVGVPAAQRTSQMRDALEYVAGVIAGPVVDPLPDLREVWDDMHCRRGKRRCHCAFCAWEKTNRPRIDEWQRAQGLRPQERHPLPFGSVGDALTRYAHWRTDGHGAESHLGPVLDRVRDEAASGVKKENSYRADREPRAAYLAGRAIDVERALVYAYQPDERRRGVRTHDCIRLLLASFVEPGWSAESWAGTYAVAETVVRGVVKSGRRAVLVELAARDMVPTPTRPDVVVRLVAERRAELDARRVV